MPRTSASCGWISSRSSVCHTTLLVRRVCAPTLYCVRIRPVVRISGNRLVERSLVGTYSVGQNLPLPRTNCCTCMVGVPSGAASLHGHRSEEHTSELQSQSNLVCRLLLEKKKKQTMISLLTYTRIHT